MVSICSRATCAPASASSTMLSARVPWPPLSTTSNETAGIVPASAHTAATLRSGEENSIAKIFIHDAPFVFRYGFDDHTPPPTGRKHLPAGFEPSFRPFNDRYPGRP